MDGLSNMINEQRQCFEKPDKYQFECALKVLEKYIRKNEFIKNFIYPWRNYDWSYTDFVKNQYDPIKLGGSSKGNVETLIRDIEIMVKIIESLVTSPNPDTKSVAKDPNNPKNDLVPCSVDEKKIKEISDIKNQIDDLRDKIKEGDQKVKPKLLSLVKKTQRYISSCAVLNSISAQGLSQNKPYSDKFFKKLDGEKSSSFYAMIGSCPTNIDNKKECEKKGYSWIPNPLFKKPDNQRGVDTKSGSCFKGRYALVDNSPGLSIGQVKSLKGLIPSLIKNIMEFSPDKLAFAAAGFGIPGLEIQQCEPFIDSSDNVTEIDHLILFIFILILILLFILVF